MEKTFLEILPLAVGATFNPTGLLLMVAILGHKVSPTRKALSFIMGSVACLFIIGFLILTIYKQLVEAVDYSHRFMGYIDIALGIAISIIIIRSVVGGKRMHKERKKRQVPYIVYGFSFMMVNSTTLILYIAACKTIAENRLTAIGTALLLLVLIAISMLMISFPLVITYAMPKGSERIMKPVIAHVTPLESRYGKQVARIIFSLIALYLLLRGVRSLMS